MIATLVVVLNGVTLPAAPPAQLIAGHVVAPLAPVVTRLVDRVTVGAYGAFELTAGGRHCTLHLGFSAATCDDGVRPLGLAPFARGGVTFVPLAEIVRWLGGEIAYDAASGTVSVLLTVPRGIATPAGPVRPQFEPTPALTPTPAPRAAETGEPHPRRTGLPGL